MQKFKTWTLYSMPLYSPPDPCSAQFLDPDPNTKACLKKHKHTNRTLVNWKTIFERLLLASN